MTAPAPAPAPPLTRPDGRPPKVLHLATVDLTLRYLLLAQLRRLAVEGCEVVAVSAPGPDVPAVEAAGVRFVPWQHATRSWNPRADLRAFWELVAILRAERPDLVHTHNPKPGVMGRLAARLAGVPCVVNTVHGLYATPEDRPAKRALVLALEALAARCSDLELYQSEEDLAWARRRRVVPPGRAELLGNGTDLRRFDLARVPAARAAALRAELGIPEGAVVVGTVGRLVAEKGYREYFQAARAVRAAEPRVQFLAVGAPDHDKADAITAAELAGVAGDVLVTGWRQDVPELLALMDVFVLASWREGMPRSAIEAAAMGRAMVLTDIRGCREVARDGKEALLVPPRDPDALAAAILRLVRDPEERARLGRAAAARARARFDEAKVAERVVSASRELLARKGLAAPAGQVTIRRARPTDAARMAALHRAGLPEAFLPTLGQRFLTRLYRALVADPAAACLVADTAAGVVGFAAGVTSVGACYRRFALRHGVPAALAAAARLVRPGTLRKLWETARYPARARGQARPLPAAELLAIAVAPGWQGGGTGRALAEGVLAGLADLGVTEAKVVVAAGNTAANRFYERVGFQLWGQLAVHEGTTSNVWTIACRSSSPPSSAWS